MQNGLTYPCVHMIINLTLIQHQTTDVWMDWLIMYAHDLLYVCTYYDLLYVCTWLSIWHSSNVRLLISKWTYLCTHVIIRLIEVSLCRHLRVRRQPRHEGGWCACIQSSASLDPARHHPCPTNVLRSHPSRASHKSVFEWRIHAGYDSPTNNQHGSEPGHTSGRHRCGHFSVHSDVSHSICCLNHPICVCTGQWSACFFLESPTAVVAHSSISMVHTGYRSGESQRKFFFWSLWKSQGIWERLKKNLFCQMWSMFLWLWQSCGKGFCAKCHFIFLNLNFYIRWIRWIGRWQGSWGLVKTDLFFIILIRENSILIWEKKGNFEVSLLFEPCCVFPPAFALTFCLASSVVASAQMFFKGIVFVGMLVCLWCSEQLTVCLLS